MNGDLTDLEWTYDGPPPRDAVEAVLLGGRERRDRLRVLAEHHLHERLAREARLGIVRRRRMVRRPEAALTDRWLDRLVRALARHRAAAVG